MKEKDRYSKALGKRIRSLRESKNISIKDFEVLENSIDRHALSRIENGKTTPSAYTLFKISKALNVPQAQLLQGIEGDV
jgi:transcriptional regulator with XRE-family HTH domain